MVLSAAAGYGQLLPQGNIVVVQESSELGTVRGVPAESGISLSELTHKVPGKARREASLARKELDKGNLPASVEHWKAAIGIDPGYLDARRELALAYVRLDDPRQVITEFDAVLKLDSHSAMAYSFIAAAHAKLLQFAEAESAARRGLAMDPANERCRYVLGATLALQEKNDADAVRYLSQASGAFPDAHLLAAHVLERGGQPMQARTHLEKYLPLAPASMRDLVTNWMARLDR